MMDDNEDNIDSLEDIFSDIEPHCLYKVAAIFGARGKGEHDGYPEPYCRGLLCSGQGYIDDFLEEELQVCVSYADCPNGKKIARLLKLGMSPNTLLDSSELEKWLKYEDSLVPVTEVNTFQGTLKQYESSIQRESKKDLEKDWDYILNRYPELMQKPAPEDEQVTDAEDVLCVLSPGKEAEASPTEVRNLFAICDHSGVNLCDNKGMLVDEQVTPPADDRTHPYLIPEETADEGAEGDVL